GEGRAGAGGRLRGSVQEVLAARIDRLDPAAKALLQTFAVVGRTVGVDLAREIAGEPDERLRSRLAVLEAGEFLYTDGAQYVFRHALTQEGGHCSLLGDRRPAPPRRARAAVGRGLAGAPRRARRPGRH